MNSSNVTSNKSRESSRLRIWAKSVIYNVGLQLVLRILTFVANAFIVRRLSKEILGLINVRILLFYTSVQFLSREAFRRTSFSSFKRNTINELEVGFINLSYCSLPLGILIGSIFWYVWVYFFELPENDLVFEYKNTLTLVLFSIIIELCVETFYVYGQRNDYIKLKIVIEGIFQFVRVIAFTLIALFIPQNAIFGFGFAQIAASITYSFSYVCYFIIFEKKKFSLFLPSLEPKIIQQTIIFFETSLQFLFNTIVKQILTEGERYIMTIFTIISLAEQGIYDVINNLASLPARLIFQQVEENSYRLFSKLIKRDMDYKEQRTSTDRAFDTLIILCRFMLIFSFLIFVYGFNFSELALYFYGGNVLIGGPTGWISISLMRYQCLYIVLIALNGILESFTFAAMNNRMMQTFSIRMIVLSLCFLLISIYTVKLFGCQGFVLGNCFNMFIRIIYSFNLIKRICDKSYQKILIQIIPSRMVTLSFVTIFAILHQLNSHFLSYRLLDKDHVMSSTILIYVFIGGLFFSFHIYVIYIFESELVHVIRDNFFSKKSKNE